jgi:peptidoglycan/LPS O-acetylase OafA/YrhL
MGRRTSERIDSLDGLRGVAALVVLLYHTTLAFGPASLVRIPPAAPFDSATWALTRTPLRIVWAGPEMVVIFFVLSGYVLALPAVKRAWGWLDSAYYPRRLLRLYLPVVAALAFATFLHLLRANTVPPGATWFVTMQDLPLSLGHAVVDASLIALPAVKAIDPVLWSLWR